MHGKTDIIAEMLFLYPLLTQCCLKGLTIHQAFLGGQSHINKGERGRIVLVNDFYDQSSHLLLSLSTVFSEILVQKLVQKWYGCWADVIQYDCVISVFYQFLQSSYDELKVFPTTAILDEKQAKHMANVKAGLGEKSITMEEQMVRIFKLLLIEIKRMEKNLGNVTM